MDGVEGVVNIEPEEYRRLRLVAEAEKYRTNVARLRVIRDETAAELCRHHVAPSNCLDCRKEATRKTEPEESA